MGEHKARFVKSIDEKALKEIKQIYERGQSQAIATAQTLLDLICKFVTGSPDASYNAQGENIFATSETFASACKKADPSVLEKQFI